MKDGMPHGFGVGLDKEEGSIYIGYFKNRDFRGKFKKFEPNGFSIGEDD